MRKSSIKSNIRAPAVAGTFYPEQPDALAHQIDIYLEESRTDTLSGEPLAFIVPHAGYVFSGWVAAYAYKAIIGKQYDTIILVGLCHSGLDFISVYDKGSFETPLGLVEIDSDLAEKIIQYNPNIIRSYPSAHRLEHSLEVQIPFLQRVLTNFKILPILINENKFCALLADAIVQSIQNNLSSSLLIGSTDLTHYPNYEYAKNIDQLAIDAILSLEPEQLDQVNRDWLNRGISNLHCIVCSEAAVKTILMASKKIGANKSVLLKYANSGDVPIGDHLQVVGYAAIAITRNEPLNSDNNLPPPSYKEIESESATIANDDFQLDDKSKIELLKIARQTLEECVHKKNISKLQSTNSLLNQPLGVFVTLKKDAVLRGCIGRFEPDAPVLNIVQEMTIAAALEDPRFEPVEPDELKEIKIEISVLSPRKRIHNINDIKIGRHGLYIKNKWFNGTLLPQVATEYGWDRNTFLSQTCRKAGLKPDAWKDKDTEIYIYSAKIFHEE